tara:strand:+ start:309 stop:650 length:342 start_codon:yes stop_codon:yes gene_type:complete
LLDAEAHSSRRLQSIRAVEHTSRIDEVYALFFVSIQNHNDRMPTIEPFGFQGLHLAFSEEVVILSEKERERFEILICHVAWSESSILLHVAIRERKYACTMPHLVEVQDVIQW